MYEQTQTYKSNENTNLIFLQITLCDIKTILVI